MSGRERLGVVFGGRSPEHEVSVTSARGVMREADAERFEVVPFGITRGGAWLTPDETRRRLERVDAGETGAIGDDYGTGVLGYPDVLRELATLDAVFPIVHGPYGEDGTLQGLFELAEIPYVGSGVAASGVGMDKELMRAAFAHAGLPQARYTVLRDGDASDPSAEALHAVESDLGYPCFVKPANGGSSVGVSKARSREDLAAAIAEAVRYDRKVMVEEGIEGREVECAVLGNADPRPSALGEIVPAAEFYSYEAKYENDATELIVPAELSDEQEAQLQRYAVRAFQAVDCAGLARVDFFVQDSVAFVIEVNTLPGFTPISMYPRLWQESGISYSDLITRLVELGVERQREALARV
ncbi:MAG: D-alanine--D-alanine ligase family protein [Dehalococcoidia bacterium]|jgi:D-alanine-D-alanine ligase|nr:D-alanine--D-alanine ligase family protein [Dehalococcoidia bacterium]